VREFVTKEFADKLFVTHKDGDKTLMDADDGMRLSTIGETIFLLRDMPCLPEFCFRMASRDAISAFHEAMTARIFLDGGFSITAMKESGVRGQDFDFRAEKDATAVCVEVTTLRPPAFSEATIQNVLGHKCKQLPPNKPGAIFCIVPETWFDVTPANSSIWS
jgi:hypothetical protein